MPWTNKGRIVYDRRIHPFTERDLKRILRSLGQSETRSVPENQWDRIITCLNIVLQSGVCGGGSSSSGTTAGYGGGLFGGGGASRSFWEPIPTVKSPDSTKYLLLIHEG